MKRLLLPLALLLSCGAHAQNKAVVYTEGGLAAAEKSWDTYYHDTADACESRYEPKTPEMETCFGAVYDIDAKVETAVRSIVALLRAYWTARAAEEEVDLPKLLGQIQAVIDDLPPEAKTYFDRVKGLL